NSNTSKAPRVRRRITCAAVLLLQLTLLRPVLILAGVMATPHGLFTTEGKAVKRSPYHLLGHGKPGGQIGRQQGQIQRVRPLKRIRKRAAGLILVFIGTGPLAPPAP